MTDTEYPEYRCSACKKEIKSLVIQCKACAKLFYHPGCANKHKIYNKDNELVKCEGPFSQFSIESDKVEMKRAGSERERLGSTGSAGSTTNTSGSGRERLGSTGSIGITANTSRSNSSSNKQSSMDVKIDWLVNTVKEMKNEIACKSEIKMMIKQIIWEELLTFKQELEEMKQKIQGGNTEVVGGSGQKSYSEIAKEKKESILIIKPKKAQESKTTKKLVKEKVDIKNLAVGITKLRKAGKGSVILGCESEGEIKQLKDTVSKKLGKDFEIMEPKKIKPKIKVINIDEDEMKLKEDNLIDTIKKQNNIDRKEEGFYIRVVKKITKPRRGNKEEGSIIIEVDEETHELMLRRGKINIGWKKCMVFNHYSIRRCFRCWGYYHIAQNCTRQETCHKCAGDHKADKCKAKKRNV